MEISNEERKILQQINQDVEKRKTIETLAREKPWGITFRSSMTGKMRDHSRKPIFKKGRVYVRFFHEYREVIDYQIIREFDNGYKIVEFEIQ